MLTIWTMGEPPANSRRSILSPWEWHGQDEEGELNGV